MIIKKVKGSLEEQRSRVEKKKTPVTFRQGHKDKDKYNPDLTMKEEGRNKDRDVDNAEVDGGNGFVCLGQGA